jgi:5-methylcytosine-specific restriction endonuclease McrA
MGKSISRLRSLAFENQRGRCYYCALPMFEGDPVAFCRLWKLTPRQSKSFLCTAEHLIPRSEGGKNSKANIVAACLQCNQTRHRCRKVPTPERWKKIRECWRPFQLR